MKGGDDEGPWSNLRKKNEQHGDPGQGSAYGRGGNDDLKNISLNPDPRMSEIPALIEKYKSYLKYSRPKRATEG